jgi:hypothetical protein
VAAGFLLAAANPPLDAARLDVMPPRLWGRAEGTRSVVRTGLEALAPWFYAPEAGPRRLLWFAATTGVAGALAIRAFMTGTS